MNAIMDAIIRYVGLGLRLPFFAVGLVLATAFAIVTGILAVAWYFVVLPIAWALVGVPIAFMSVSFRGQGTQQLASRLRPNVLGWKRSIRQFFDEWTDNHEHLWRWFMEGSR